MTTVTSMNISLHSSMLHFAFLPVIVVVCALVCGSCEANVNSTSFSSLQGRVINDEYRDKNFTVRSKLDCLQFQCLDRLSHCAVSYNSRTNQCMLAPINGWLIIWDLEKFTKIDPNWATYITKFVHEAIDRPAFLYLLDSVSKGTNLGSKGSEVNLIETGLTDWSALGPCGVHSHLKYLNFDKDNRAEIPYEISTGSYHIDFTGSYTIAAWVKTDTSVVDKMPIIEGDRSNCLPYFWFSPSKNQDQLKLSPKLPSPAYTSPVNATGKQYWRHVAVVYRGFKDVQFYLNGSSFGQTDIKASQDKLQQTKKLYLGHASSSQLFGAMACVTFHEKALSQAQVAALMTVCP